MYKFLAVFKCHAIENQVLVEDTLWCLWRWLSNSLFLLCV